MLRRLARSTLERLGYVLWKRDFMPFGVDPWADVNRLCQAWGGTITIAFDVGANNGQTLGEFLPAFPAARVHAFEPFPITFERLQAATSDRRATLHRLALGDTDGVVPFYVYGVGVTGTLMNSLTPNAGFAMRGGQAAKTVEVESLTLDAFCTREAIAQIDVLKVDTEGFDLRVLKGGEGMFRDGRIRFVYVEFNDLLDRDGIEGGSLLPIAQFLAPFGLRYVAAYTDRVQLDGGPMWVSANALFALPPGQVP